MMKRCAKCKKVKALSEFAKDKRRDDGRGSYCYKCERIRDKKRNRQRVQQRRNQGLCVRCGCAVPDKRWRCEKCAALNKRINQKWYRQSSAKDRMIRRAQSRARELGIPCNLTPGDLDIPDVCPVLGIKLDNNEHELKPSIDRIIPQLGYVKENVCVISLRANRIKADATADELRRIANYIDEYS